MPLNVGDFLASAVNPAEVDTFSLLGYVPTPRQQEFHEASWNRADRIFYGGAVGGGKSCAALMDAIRYAANFPKIAIGMHRKSFPELDKSFIRELGKWDFAKNLAPLWNGIPPRWNKTSKILSFPNGSIIEFMYAETVADVTKIQGAAYQLLYFDEAALNDPRVIQQLEERIRSGDRLVPPIGARYASNPGGQAHQYFKDLFIKATDYGRHPYVYSPEGSTKALTHIFIPAKLSDNPHMNADYIDSLNAIPDPQRRAAMRDGDWDATAGQFFTQWSRARHVIPIEATFNIPAEWQRYAGVDYGVHDSWAVIWIALDNDGRMWAYREYCLTDVQAPQQAQLILAAEVAAQETSVIHVADPSMWGQRGTPYSIADIYGLEGVGLLKANNDRVVGWSLCHQRLNEGPICEYHKYQKDLGLWHENSCPMFHVFESACPKFIETVPTLPRDDIRPDDAKTRNVEDHMADAWRYVNMYAGHYARPLIYEDYTPPTPQQVLERMNARPAVDYSQPMNLGMSSEGFHFPTDLNNPSSRGGW